MFLIFTLTAASWPVRLILQSDLCFVFFLHYAFFVCCDLYSRSTSTSPKNASVTEELTLAIVVIPVSWGVMFAQSLQDELVVHEALDWFEKKGI